MVSRSRRLRCVIRISLFHKRAIKSTIQLVIDKVQWWLNGFDGKLLSLASKVTLEKSILLEILSYFMQSIMILIGLYKKIEQIVRTFVWDLTSNGRGMHLVKWETCCQLMKVGGLRLKKLVPHNMSFLMKISYQLVNNWYALWVQILQCKYKMKDFCP